MGRLLYSVCERYHSDACKTILFSPVFFSHHLQMQQYRNRKSSTFEATTTKSAVQDNDLVSADTLAPTRFKVHDSVYKKKTTRHGGNASSVEAEYQKYVSGSTFEETNILQFWEVRHSYAFGSTTHSLCRLIRWNSRRCFQWRWIISRSRRRPFLVSAYSHQQRTQTPRSETGSIQFSWRPFKCLNTRSRKNASTSWTDGQHRKLL